MSEIFAAKNTCELRYVYKRNGLNDDQDHLGNSSNEHVDSSEDEGAKVSPMDDDSISDAFIKLKFFQGAMGSLLHLPPHRIRPTTAKQSRDHQLQDEKKQVARESNEHYDTHL